MANAPALNFPITATDKTAQAFARVGGRVKGLTSSFGGLKTAIAAVGMGALLGKAIQVSREFEVLRASLKTVTGSAENATAAFSMIQEFAATTPFSLQQATEAFIRLKSLGLEPSREAMISYGNTASAMGKNLIQYVEAIADATTGEFERLKEFGIKASTEGEKVSFTFQGVTTTVKKGAAEIEQYLRSLGNAQFAGAMAERAATLDGALSNLGDSVAVLFDKMGQGGLAGGVAAVARAFSDVTGKSAAAAGEFGRLIGLILTGFADKIPAAMQLFADYLKFVVNFWTEAFQKLIETLGWVADKLSALPLIGDKFEEWAAALEQTSLSVEEFQTKWEGTNETINQTGNEIRVVSEVINNQLTPAVEASGAATEKSAKQWENLAKRIKTSVETPSETLNRELSDLDVLLEKGLISWEEYARAIEDAYDRAEKKTDETLGKVDKKSTEVFEDLGSEIENFARRGEFSMDSLKNAALSALQSIIDKALESKVSLDDLILADGGGIGGIFKSIGSAALGMFGGGGSGADPFAFEGVRARSMGGRVIAGRGYDVGEQGKERFIPAVNGTIIPAHRLDGGGGTVVVNVTTNVHAPNAELGFEERVRQVIRDEQPRQVAAAVEAVQQTAGFGGGFAKSMGRRS